MNKVGQSQTLPRITGYAAHVASTTDGYIYPPAIRTTAKKHYDGPKGARNGREKNHESDRHMGVHSQH